MTTNTTAQPWHEIKTPITLATLDNRVHASMRTDAYPCVAICNDEGMLEDACVYSEALARILSGEYFVEDEVWLEWINEDDEDEDEDEDDDDAHDEDEEEGE